jgi:hypothetical protein
MVFARRKSICRHDNIKREINTVIGKAHGGCRARQTLSLQNNGTGFKE